MEYATNTVSARQTAPNSGSAPGATHCFIALLAAVLGALLLACLSERTPAPLPATVPATTFSAGRALVDLEEIARQPRVPGSSWHAQSREYLKNALERIGLQVTTQEVPLSPRSRGILKSWAAPDSDTVMATNIIGVLPGHNRDQPAVAIMAHYDTVSGSPGAADDGAGVVAALEIARAIKAGAALERDLVVILTDAEEVGLEGARGFFERHPLAKRIGVVVNMEARGAGGRAAMFETGGDNGAMMELFRRAVANPSTNSLGVFIYKVLPNDTDYTIPKRLGIAGFNFAFLGRSGLYHSPLATVATLDPGSLQHMGAQALAITRALLEVPKLPGKASDSVFADVFGRTMVTYPSGFGWVLLAASGACLGFAWLRARGTGELGWRQINGGITVTLWTLFHAMLLLRLGNLLSGSATVDVNYYDRLAAIPRLEFQAVLLCFIALLAAALVIRPTRRLLAIFPALGLTAAAVLFSGFTTLGLITCGIGVVAALLSLMLPVARPGIWAGWLGAALPIFIMSLVMQATIPTASPLFAWPLLLAAVIMALVAAFDPQLQRWVTFALLAAMTAIGGGWCLILAHLNFLALGASLPEVTALFVVLLLLFTWPILRGLQAGRTLASIALTALVGATVLALWVRFDPLAPSVAPYSITTHDKAPAR